MQGNLWNQVTQLIQLMYVTHAQNVIWRYLVPWHGDDEYICSLDSVLKICQQDMLVDVSGHCTVWKSEEQHIEQVFLIQHASNFPPFS